MGQRSDWKLKLCALMTALGVYLLISALLSTQSLSFPAHHYDLSSGRKSSQIRPGIGPKDDQNYQTEAIAVRPRNLAGVVEMSRRLSPRRIRSGRKIDWCHPVGFKAAPGPVIALASFPGSGNTWVRYLLQQATGILSGSVYKDYALLKNGFPAESIVNGSVLLVKTHEFGAEARRQFQRAIILVRDPFASLQAEFNRRAGGHIGFASADKYKRNGGRHWRNFVYSMADDWEKMNLDWYYNFLPKYRLIVFYDKLKNNTETELRRILEFLRVSVSNSTMKCVLEKKEGIYKRGKKPLNFSPYDEAMKELLLDKQKRVYKIMQEGESHRLFKNITVTDLFTSNGTESANIELSIQEIKEVNEYMKAS